MRLFSMGFELNWNVTNGEWSTNPTNACTIQSTVKRSGSYAAQITGMTSAQSTGFNIGPGIFTVYFGRFYFRLGTAPTAGNTILRLASGTVAARVKVNADRTLELSDEDGVIGTSSALALDTWYRIEVHFDQSGAGGTHIVRLYIDGVEVAGATNRDIVATINTFEFGGNRNGESQTQGNWYFDDIAINNNAGGDQTGLPGPGRIVHAIPIGNGDANVSAIRGGADTGADWSQVSEVTPNDATDYMELSSTTGAMWVVTNGASLGIGDGDTITLVSVGARITLASAAAGNWLASIKSQSGGTVLDSAVVGLAVATWDTHDDSSGAKQHKVTAYTDPQTGAAWKAKKLSTMQLGAKTTDGTPATRISTLWALIEYVEVAPAGPMF